MKDFSLLIILVPFGRARKIVKYAKDKGLTGATIMIAFGTVKSKVLDFLGIQETRKELILTAGYGDFLDGLMDELNKKFNLTRKNFGIAFRMPLSFINIKNEVVDASLEAGARGGTIIHARGSGLNQTKLIFDMEIEPEKEIVLTIVDDDQLENIVEAIRKKSDVEKEGHGILFVIPVSKAYGIK